MKPIFSIALTGCSLFSEVSRICFYRCHNDDIKLFSECLFCKWISTKTWFFSVCLFCGNLHTRVRLSIRKLAESLKSAVHEPWGSFQMWANFDLLSPLNWRTKSILNLPEFSKYINPNHILEYYHGNHCVKSLQIRRYFWSVFPCIRTEYGEIVSLRIQ